MKQTKNNPMKEGNMIDVSGELYRTYTFRRSGEFYKIRVDNPKYLIVLNDAHQIIGKDNRQHYIPMGWAFVTLEKIKEVQEVK